ncbi:MAG: LCP family protein [Oscillospiraceae bacterium]
MEKRKISPKTSKKKVAAIVIGSILLLLVAALCIGKGIANHYLDKINKIEAQDIETIPPEKENFLEDVPDGENVTVIAPEDIQWADTVVFEENALINIMLIGQDRREGQARQRSDTMILCSINTETKQVSLISFLRDLYVQIPGGYSANRLNAAYAFGGFPLLSDTIYTNFGITIDGSIEVDFERFIDVIDAMDGVDMELTAAEASIVRGGSVAGHNHLNGTQALAYARIRKLDDDFGRTARQRKILEAAFQKIKTFNFVDLLSLMDVMLPSLSTDLSNDQILFLCVKCSPLLRSVELNSYYVPEHTEYHGAKIRGMSVLVPDLEQIRAHLQNEYLPLS